VTEELAGLNDTGLQSELEQYNYNRNIKLLGRW